MGRRLLSDRLRVEVEQHIARGSTAQFACEQLGISEVDFWWVWLRMEEVNAEPAAVPHPTRVGCGCRCG